MPIGERIRAERIARKMKQGTLAASAGITAKHLNQIERGVFSNPTLQVLRKIEAALDLPPGSLMADEDSATPYCPDDPDLQRLAAAWPSLPPEKRAALATLAEERATYNPDPEPE
jgi:transcriptional regulator with XRE-family HTH domain